VRQQANIGVLADAFVDEAFCRAIVEAIGAKREIACARGALRFTPTRAFAELAKGDIAALPVSRPAIQSSNTIISLGDSLFLKGYRHPRAGQNPELEVGRYLTEVARFGNCVPLAGAVEYHGADGGSMTLALLQAYVPNQGDGWTYPLDYLARFLEAHGAAAGAPAADAHGGYLSLMRTLGARTAELHRAFAQSAGDPAFDPEPVAPRDVSDWKQRVHDEAVATLELLQRRRGELTLPVREDAQRLQERRATLLERIDACPGPGARALKTRYHGDFHLGQLLITRNDFVIVDFEGEPARPLPDRRQKHSPLRDVAGMLRSFDYARWAALRQVGERIPDSSKLEQFAAAWVSESRRVFVDAYDEAARGSGTYASFDEARRLLELFELEKAFYELRYELNNRPGWVAIPLQGILALTGTGAVAA
jgi:maltose alpha-D-glucosyltransferase/alpha-amylase